MQIIITAKTAAELRSKVIDIAEVFKSPCEVGTQPQTMIIPEQLSFSDALLGSGAAPAKVGRKKQQKEEPKVEIKEETKVEASEIVHPAPKETKLTINEAKIALEVLKDTTDLKTCIDILKTFGAARVSELKEEDYGAFITACYEKTKAE